MKGSAPGQQLVERDPQSPHVTPRVHVARGLHLLRRHVEGATERGQRAGERAVAGQLGDTEVQHLDPDPLPCPARQEEIGRLDVAVDHARRVGLGQRLTRLQHVRHRLRHRERPPGAELVREIAPFEVLHQHVGLAVRRGAHVEHLDHVLAPEARGDPRLAHEARV